MKLWNRDSKFGSAMRWKPLLTAAGGTGILIVGMVSSCNTTGNPLTPVPDAVQTDGKTTDFGVSGNLLPPDAGPLPTDTAPDVPELILSGNLLPPDTDVITPPPDTGPDVPDEGPPAGNLLPPDTDVVTPPPDTGPDVPDEGPPVGNLLPPETDVIAPPADAG